VASVVAVVADVLFAPIEGQHEAPAVDFAPAQVDEQAALSDEAATVDRTFQLVSFVSTAEVLVVLVEPVVHAAFLEHVEEQLLPSHANA
jgi:hypothetical protein